MRATKPRQSGEDEEALAAILAEAIERLRRGETPQPGDYAERYPHLREGIQSHFETLELLDELGREQAERSRIPAAALASGEPAASVGSLIAGLSPLLQRVIYLRNFEKRLWSEIASIAGRPEMELRRLHAGAIRELIRQTSGI